MSGNEDTADLKIEEIGGCFLARPSGRIDHTNAHLFDAGLMEAVAGFGEGSGLVIDLSDVAFITSAGLRALFRAQKALLAKQGRMIVAGANGAVLEVIEIAKFDKLLTLAPDSGAAAEQVRLR